MGDTTTRVMLKGVSFRQGVQKNLDACQFAEASERTCRCSALTHVCHVLGADNHKKG